MKGSQSRVAWRASRGRGPEVIDIVVDALYKNTLGSLSAVSYDEARNAKSSRSLATLPSFSPAYGCSIRVKIRLTTRGGRSARPVLSAPPGK